MSIWDVCREVNVYLNIAAAVVVMWRLVPMVLDRPQWRHALGRHFLYIFGYITFSLLISAGGAAFHLGQGSESTFWTGLRTLATLALVLICLFWPYPKRFRMPDEGS